VFVLPDELCTYAAPHATPLTSASDVARYAWDAMVSDADFFHSRDWLHGLDEALGPASILAVLGPTGLMAGCAVWDGECSPGLFDLRTFFPVLPGPWQREFLWIGARRSTHNEIPCVIGPRRAAALRTLMRAMLEAAEQRQRIGVVIPYMPLAKAIEIAAADEHARILIHSAEAILDVPDGGLASVLAEAGTRRRWKTRNELAVFAEKGNVTHWSSITPELENAAAELIAQNRARHGSHQGAAWMRRVLAGQRRAGVLDRAVAAVAVRDQRIISIAIFYHFGNYLHLRYFGSDYAVEDNDFRYFVLCYYAPLDYAATHGIRTYSESISSLEAKSSRGATIEPLAAVVAFTGHSALATDLVAKHNREFVRAFRTRFRHRLGSDWSIFAG
jgi:uncharacterized protein